MDILLEYIPVLDIVKIIDNYKREFETVEKKELLNFDFHISYLIVYVPEDRESTRLFFDNLLNESYLTRYKNCDTCHKLYIDKTVKLHNLNVNNYDITTSFYNSNYCFLSRITIFK